ncbi:MAG TPA: hypothetical protein VFE37_25950 [Chloroflexota bacterium]|nr:hypothetical protein [Chloroflexota bacterium]
MPFCPACRTEYQAGAEQCADCGAALVAALPPAPRRLVGRPVVEVPIATFPDYPRAAMWAEWLRGEGILSVLVPLGPGAGGWGSSALVPHELRVAQEDVDLARTLLRDMGHQL